MSPISRCSCEGFGACACVLNVENTDTVLLTKTGNGTALQPWLLKADSIANSTDGIASWEYDGDVEVGIGYARWRFPIAATILGASAAISDAPTGSSLIIDVNLNGTTIFTTQANRPTIPAGANDSGTEDVPNITAVAAGQYLTIDRDQIGSTLPGSILTVFVRYSTA